MEKTKTTLRPIPRELYLKSCVKFHQEKPNFEKNAFEV